VDESRRQADSAVMIDGTRVDAYSVLAAGYAMRIQTAELESVLSAAEKTGSGRFDTL
jgi:hypothetical protein